MPTLPPWRRSAPVTSGPGRIARRPTARPSGSSRRRSPSGPMPARTNQTTSGWLPFRAGSQPTITSALTPLWPTGLRWTSSSAMSMGITTRPLLLARPDRLLARPQILSPRPVLGTSILRRARAAWVEEQAHERVAIPLLEPPVAPPAVDDQEPVDLGAA